ncbi:MAG TPA: hypothetical protein VH054_11205 [Polyangiaceae bacterium]|nr:hypothetical protein [Polyangiaceae bacterium]
MRFALVFVLAACTPSPPPCASCNPPVCPDPVDVIPDASCNVVPLVCPMTCGLKCQCWNDAWTCILGTDCDAGDAGEVGDAAQDASVD